MIRRQLPAYSPLSLAAIGKAALSSLLGPKVARGALQALLQARFGCPEVILTGSGTQALQLAIQWACAGVRPPCPVALPAYSCFDVATAAVGAEIPVRFYDLDPLTLSPDMDSLRGAARRGAKVVVAANLFGFPLDWDSVRTACRESGAALIEDAAQGLGSTWKGEPGGTFGDLTVLSFGRGKGWTGCGGGALLAREGWRASAGQMELPVRPAPTGSSPKAAVVSLAQWGLGRPSLYGLPSGLPGLGLGATHYRSPAEPRDMASFSAALALATSEPAGAAVEGRRSIAARWEEMLSAAEVQGSVQTVRAVEGGTSSYLRFPVLLGNEQAPRSARGSARLPGLGDLQEAGVLGLTRGFPRPLPELDPIARFRRGNGEGFPGAEVLAHRLVTLPTHAFVAESDLASLRHMLSLVAEPV